MQNYYKGGDYNAYCDSCGGKFKASQLKLQWDGLRVCERDWNPKPLADIPVRIREQSGVPWSRPLQEAYSTSGTQLSLKGFVLLVKGVGVSGQIDGIKLTSTVTVTMSQLDGVAGTYTITIQPTIGFTVTSTSKQDNSSLSYSVTL